MTKWKQPIAESQKENMVLSHRLNLSLGLPLREAETLTRSRAASRRECFLPGMSLSTPMEMSPRSVSLAH